MHGLQEDKLPFAQEQKDLERAFGTLKTLQMVQKAHSAQRNKVKTQMETDRRRIIYGLQIRRILQICPNP